MSGKVCKRGHAFAGYLDVCPFCVTTAVTRPTDSNATAPLNNVTPVTKIGRGRPKRYENNAARQRAYRQRKGAT